MTTQASTSGSNDFDATAFQAKYSDIVKSLVVKKSGTDFITRYITRLEQKAAGTKTLSEEQTNLVLRMILLAQQELPVEDVPGEGESKPTHLVRNVLIGTAVVAVVAIGAFFLFRSGGEKVLEVAAEAAETVVETAETVSEAA